MSFLLVFLTFLASDALLCYRCFSDTGNSSCISRPRTFPWAHCDGHCQVWRLYSEADLSIYMFERSCSSHCRTGCTHLTDMEHRFVGCSFCCDTNFCNSANSAGHDFAGVALFIALAQQLFA